MFTHKYVVDTGNYLHQLTLFRTEHHVVGCYEITTTIRIINDNKVKPEITV